MDRLPRPLTRRTLLSMMEDERYRDPSHPEHASYLLQVRRAFREVPLGSLEDDGDGGDTGGGRVHVRAYTQVRDGETVEVSEHERGAPPRSEDAPTAPDRRLEREWGEGETVEVVEHDPSAPVGERSNAAFRNLIAEAERSADKKDGGYREYNPVSGALGRYQMTPKALADIEWRKPNGEWSLAVRHEFDFMNDEGFLNNPAAQEAAMGDLLRKYEQQAEDKGLFRRVGQRIEGREGEFTVTEAGIMAAIHRGGAEGTRKYFEKIDGARGDSNKAVLEREERWIETRLRTFEDATYVRSKAR